MKKVRKDLCLYVVLAIVGVCLMVLCSCGKKEDNAESKMITLTIQTPEEVLYDGKAETELNTLGEFLREADLVEFDGTMIITVANVGSDCSGAHGTYWAIYVNGEYAMYGADDLVLEESSEYKLSLEEY